MEIWSKFGTSIQRINARRISDALDRFVESITVGWATEMAEATENNIWLIHRYNDVSRYGAHGPIPNALILFFIDVANVN